MESSRIVSLNQQYFRLAFRCLCFAFYSTVDRNQAIIWRATFTANSTCSKCSTFYYSNSLVLFCEGITKTSMGHNSHYWGMSASFVSIMSLCLRNLPVWLVLSRRLIGGILDFLRPFEWKLPLLWNSWKTQSWGTVPFIFSRQLTHLITDKTHWQKQQPPATTLQKGDEKSYWNVLLHRLWMVEGLCGRK